MQRKPAASLLERVTRAPRRSNKTDGKSSALVAYLPRPADIEREEKAAAAPGKDELPVYVRIAEVEAALTYLSPRPRAFVRFLWLTGARVSEALAVTVADLDTGARAVRIRTLKRRRVTWRACPLPGDYLAELAILIAGGLRAADRLFPWSRSRGFELCRDAFMQAGIERPKCHPHALRHGHAIHAIEAGVPLNIVQRALGHAWITTTGRYLRATGADVRREYDRVKW